MIKQLEFEMESHKLGLIEFYDYIQKKQFKLAENPGDRPNGIFIRFDILKERRATHSN